MSTIQSAFFLRYRVEKLTAQYKISLPSYSEKVSEFGKWRNTGSNNWSWITSSKYTLDSGDYGGR